MREVDFGFWMASVAGAVCIWGLPRVHWKAVVPAIGVDWHDLASSSPVKELVPVTQYRTKQDGAARRWAGRIAGATDAEGWQ
jgi:hypothetical protein